VWSFLAVLHAAPAGETPGPSPIQWCPAKVNGGCRELEHCLKSREITVEEAPGRGRLN
jgi:hypothetical protein